MKTLEMKTLLFVTAVALFPIACGTTSPTGPDTDGDGSVSALRASEPLPPIAPEPPSPNSVPQPQSPGADDTKPSPEPQSPGADDTKPAEVPDAGGVPVPVPVSADPTSPEGVPDRTCLVASIEITETILFAGNPGLSLDALLFDKAGVPITDASCSKLGWRVEATQTDGNRVSSVIIDSSPDGRRVTLSGPAGVYKVGVTAPNGIGASRLVTLQGPPVGAPTTTVTAPTAPALGGCQAVSVDISSVPVTHGAAAWAFQAILTDAQGREITDASCDIVLWVIDGVSAGTPSVISYGANSRQVTVTGLVAGTYKLGATTPNGKSGALVLQIR